jgi:hypothetical protein
MTLFPDQLGDLVFDVGFHQIRGQCTEHPDATGMKQQEKPRGVGEAVNHQEIRLPLRRTEFDGGVGDRVKLATAETELACVRMVLAHVKLDRDELRQERDEWRREAEMLCAEKL